MGAARRRGATSALDSQGEVVIVGCGAIGLPLAVAFAVRGLRVLGYDIDRAKVEALSHRRQPLLDEGLDSALHQALDEGRIRFAASLAPADAPRAFIIATPTPGSAASGFDARCLNAAAEAVAAVAREDDLLCVRSTTPIGTARALAARYPRLRVAACPDRTLSGRAFAEQFAVPHIVGGADAPAGDAAEALFSGLGAVVRVRDAETAEAIKLFGNVQRDVHFALANQFALICESAGIDFSEVRAAGAADYPRFVLARPGPVGGPCLTKDVHLLASSAALAGHDLDFLLAARRLNETLPARIAAQILAHIQTAPGPVAVLGLSFKGEPPTRDRRGAMAEALAAELRRLDPEVELRFWDPADATPPQGALDGASVVVLANDDPTLADCAQRAGEAAVFDLTGVLQNGVAARRFGDAGAQPCAR